MPLKTTPLHRGFGVEAQDASLSALQDAAFDQILQAFFARGGLGDLYSPIEWMLCARSA